MRIENFISIEKDWNAAFQMGTTAFDKGSLSILLFAIPTTRHTASWFLSSSTAKQIHSIGIHLVAGCEMAEAAYSNPILNRYCDGKFMFS